jgi:hypothetical protein
LILIFSQTPRFSRQLLLYAANSNQIDTSIFIQDVISIGTINPTVKKVTIDNIYRIEGGLGYMDWAPELEELTLIGFKGSIEILKYITRNTKLKKINLINCITSIPDIQDISINPKLKSPHIYSNKIKDLDTYNLNNFIKLAKWCKSKLIAINVTGYQNDENKEIKSTNFPYMTKLEYKKNLPQSNIINSI